MTDEKPKRGPGRPRKHPKPDDKPAEIELTPELIAAVAAKLKESGLAPSDDTEKFKAIAKEVALAVANEARSDAGVFRRSKEPFQATYPFNPKNYNIIREAEKLAEKRGHTLGSWQDQPADHTRTPLLQPVNAWHARCIRCGAMATAKWMPPTQNDKRADRTDPNTGEQAVFPALGGDALNKNENLILTKERRANTGFSGIAARSEMSARPRE